MANKYLFRIAPKEYHPLGYSIVKEELYTHGHLRQGWGGHKADLGSKENPLPQSTWIKNFTSRDIKELEKMNVGADKYYIRKHEQLALMLNMKKGDILIIPYLPDNGFTICKVTDVYRFEPLYDKTLDKYPDDFGHVIPVKVLKSKNNLELDIESVQTIERFFRKGGCIVPIRKADVIKAIDNLVESMEPQQESTYAKVK